MKGLVKIYSDTPPAGKVAIILLVIVVLIVLFFLIKKAFEEKEANEKTPDAAASELDQLVKYGQGPHYSASQFAAFADRLERYMSGAGTDEDGIGDVFSYMQNKADVLQLIKSFGIRDYTDDKLLVFNIKQLNLAQWLSEELDPEDMKEYVNDKLKANGVNYSF